MTKRRKIRWPKVGEDVCVEWKDACLYTLNPPHRQMGSISEQDCPLQPSRSSGTVAYISREAIGLAQTVSRQTDGGCVSSELMVVARSDVTRVRRYR